MISLISVKKSKINSTGMSPHGDEKRNPHTMVRHGAHSKPTARPKKRAGEEGAPATEPAAACKPGPHQKRKERKRRRELGGLVIGGKLRGCEGIADIAFLEWLLRRLKCPSPRGRWLTAGRRVSKDKLWNQYQECARPPPGGSHRRRRDYGRVPEDYRPRSAHKPQNLQSQQRAVGRRQAAFKENVVNGRAKVDGLAADESVLQFILRTVCREQAEQAERPTKRRAEEPGIVKTSNPFELLAFS